MRRNGETMMAAVTWRYVPRVTCHVPPREPFEKCCVRAAAQTGSGRGPKLSGQKRLGLNCVSLGESALTGDCDRGQGTPGDNFIVFSLLPSSSVTLGPRDPKFGTRVHLSKGYPNMHNLGFQKLGGQNFGFLKFLFCIFSLFLHNSSKNVENDIFWKFKILTPLNFWPPNWYIFWKPLLNCIHEPNFVKFRRRVSELEGIRLKHKIVPCGHNFDPSRSSLA